MSYDEINIYSHPEALGWSAFASLDILVQDYEFNILAVLKTDDGRLVYQTSSGCSCPAPFEEWTRAEDWIEITSISSFSTYVSGIYNGSYNPDPAFPQQFNELLEKLSLAGIPA